MASNHFDNDFERKISNTDDNSPACGTYQNKYDIWATSYGGLTNEHETDIDMFLMQDNTQNSNQSEMTGCFGESAASLKTPKTCMTPKGAELSQDELSVEGTYRQFEGSDAQSITLMDKFMEKENSSDIDFSNAAN